MISPHTPPGTKIECIALPDQAPEHVDIRQSIISVGACYEVAGICPDKTMEPIPFGVALKEHQGFIYGLCLFRRVTDISGLVEIARGVDIKAPGREKIDA